MLLRSCYAFQELCPFEPVHALGIPLVHDAPDCFPPMRLAHIIHRFRQGNLTITLSRKIGGNGLEPIDRIGLKEQRNFVLHGIFPPNSP